MTDNDNELETPDGDEEAARPLSDLLVEQVEVSNLVVCNKADLCTEAELDEAVEQIGRAHV